MFYNPYSLWNMYVLIRTIHGVFITYTFFIWLLGSMSFPFIYMMSCMYNPYEVKQLEDKEKIKQIKLNDID